MEDFDGRVAKRQKHSNGTAIARPHRPGASRVFAPFRTVGLVSSTPVPFTSVPVGKTTFQITTSVGQSLQTYDIRRGLHLLFVTRPLTPELITATAAWRDKVLAAWGGGSPHAPRGVWVFRRGKREAELELPRTLHENVSSICVFGSWIVGVCDTRLLVWKTASFELYTTLQGISPVPFTDCIASLPTFLNKIIVGRQDGSAEIWNVSSAKLLYAILPPSASLGAVTAIEPTPALSLVAIAYEQGPVLIHDVRADETAIMLEAAAGAPVTSITFRTDGLGAGRDGREPGVMATASTRTGDITLWDLNDGGRKAGVLRAAHAHPTATVRGGVSKVGFLPGQAIIVSSGLDNSLKTWILDETPFSPIPRILHERSGHGAPITKLHFLPTGSDGAEDTGKWLMSGSKDRSLWGWSLRRDAQSTELSQGAVQSKARKQGLLSAGFREGLEELKCPPVKAMACSLNRDGGIGAVPGKQPIWQGAKGKKVDAEVSAMTGWESVITAHENDARARTWFWGRKRAGRWAFPTADGGAVSSVAMSPCGTFALVGSDMGSVDMFNMQSGLHRQHFPTRLTPAQAKQLRLDTEKRALEEEDDGGKKYYRGQGRHTSAVVGLGVDELNKTVISAGADGKIKFWNFGTGLLVHQADWSLSTSITGMELHRASNLAAFTCTDACIRIVDLSNYRLIRELRAVRTAAPGFETTSMEECSISSDARWVVAAAGDVVLLWDLPTGHLVDGFKLRGRCTSLGFSPTGEFLATTITDSVGVDIWSNKALFTHVPTRHIGAEELLAVLRSEAQTPTVSGEGGWNTVALASEELDDAELPGEHESDLDKALDQLSVDLVSLSVVPRSRWQNLLHLDLIRQRNKPTEPPKRPEKAPFFLPSLQDRPAAKGTQLPRTSEVEEDMAKERSRVGKYTADGSRSAFTTLLGTAKRTTDFAAVLDHLKGLSPAAADIEIRSLSAAADELVTFVRALTWLTEQRRDFELGQAWMAVFLRVHGHVVPDDAELRSTVEEWKVALGAEGRRVQRLAEYCGGMVGYLLAARV